MAITVTLKGTDLKFSNGVSIDYYPVSQVKQRVVGSLVEIWRGGELIRSDEAASYTSPSGTAEQIGDAISTLSSDSEEVSDSLRLSMIISELRLSNERQVVTNKYLKKIYEP
tara:strand:+ start:224 stop:559 length:336 start_codon:yes stop_codon:yes gene_type:complete